MMKNKLLPLLKVSISGNLNLFNIGKKNNNKSIEVIKRYSLFVLLTLLLAYIFGYYSYMIAKPLSEVGLTYIIIAIMSIASVGMTFIQGIYKAQGVLFSAKDNDLLFSMPIKKRTIFLARILALLAFQYLWNLIIILPTFAVYAYLEVPTIGFYITALIIYVTLPIIPTIAAVTVAYMVQGVASKFKYKRITQILGTIIVSVAIFMVSFKLQNFIENIAEKASSINIMLEKIYYPVAINNQCIIEFSFSKLVLIILFNALLLIASTYLLSITYFKVISKLHEKSSKSKYIINDLKTGTTIKALMLKETKRYFSSPIYVMNTMFGPIILMIACIYSIISAENLIAFISTEFGDISGMVSKALMAMIFIILAMSTTTASSISIEGKNLWLTKSLPVSEKKIFLAKIFLNLLITVPFGIIATIIFALRLKFSFIDVIYCLIISMLGPLLTSILGIIVNLKYPKLNGASDVAIVKQSLSVLISVYLGILMGILPIIVFFLLDITNVDAYVGIVILILACVTWILWKILKNYGVKRFRTLNN